MNGTSNLPSIELQPLTSRVNAAERLMAMSRRQNDMLPYSHPKWSPWLAYQMQPNAGALHAVDSTPCAHAD
jgi:hypothetical protein